jgi:HD-like signal output (HDOD) protein
MKSSENITNSPFAAMRLRKPASAGVRKYAEQLALAPSNPAFDDLLSIATSDPLLAVWILKKANNSFYGIRSTVDSLSKAFDILGLRGIARMIAHTSSSEFADAVLAESSTVSRAEKALQRHSVATAVVAAHLGGEDYRQAGPLFTAGLLHDIGKHLIFHNFRDEAKRIYSESSLWDQIKGTDLQAVESLAFGFNHSEAGEFLGRKMQFPPGLNSVVRNAFSPYESEVEHGSRALMVHAACLFVSSEGYAAGKRVSVNQCVSSPIWQTLISRGLVSYQSVDAIMKDLHSLQEVLSRATVSLESRSGLPLNSDLPPSAPARPGRPARYHSGHDQIDSSQSLNK